MFELDAYETLQRAMIRTRPDAFTRQEWAYLIATLDRRNLEQVVASKPQGLTRPRGPVALWLPNNVSLLGPLTVILLTLTGNPVRVKAGSHSTDLTTAFVAYAREQNLDIFANVRIEQFDRHDPRNAEMAAHAKMRIVFGSDEAAAAIDRLPHPLDSIGFYFSDRSSEAWIEAGAMTDEQVVKLIQVFAIYGRAGCTSPRRVVVIDGSDDDCRALVDRMRALWPRGDVAMHHASQNVMAAQWGRALGWNAQTAPRNAAVLATGNATTEPDALFFLPIVAASLDDAIAQLPPNIQTLGHASTDKTFARWLPRLASTRVKRIVPIAAMHHFGPVWDGWAWWRAAFEEVEVG